MWWVLRGYSGNWGVFVVKVGIFWGKELKNVIFSYYLKCIINVYEFILK